MIQVHHSHRGEPIFHLKSGDSSYVMSVFHGYLLHLYCGAQVSDDDLEYLLVQIPHDSVVPRPAHTYEADKWFSCDASTAPWKGHNQYDKVLEIVRTFLIAKMCCLYFSNS